MPCYTVTYSDPEATYPAPEQTVTVDLDASDIWNHAASLGVVQKIFDLDQCRLVFSSHWNYNRIGVTQAQIAANLGI
jgi:hypothetical protein